MVTEVSLLSPPPGNPSGDVFEVKSRAESFRPGARSSALQGKAAEALSPLHRRSQLGVLEGRSLPLVKGSGVDKVRLGQLTGRCLSLARS